MNITKFFQLEINHNSLKTGIIAGITTFIADIYIIVVRVPFADVCKIGIVTLIFLLGLFLTIVLVAKRVKSAFIIGMMLSTLLALQVGRWLGDVSQVTGEAQILISWGGAYAIPDFSRFFKAGIFRALQYSYIPVIFAMLFVDMFESIANFAGVSEAAGIKNKNGYPRNIKELTTVNDFTTLLLGLFCTGSRTAYIESATGIEKGRRTGLMAVITGLLFLLFLFILPLAALVPAIIMAWVLALVCVFMAMPLGKIHLNNLEKTIPAFLTIIFFPLTYCTYVRSCLRFFVIHTYQNIQRQSKKNFSYALDY